ncbi:MAG TPA: molybdenum cofactor guanylyltransferase MobA [Alphaproteobacteria bacterium]|nr:molybdenum cofactor guanylyltransferase MobA [Pelagibacteraceae bacterium]MDP6784023.1 molybdenum cofactor guanylyltransferase MobA [Alphaproteobacteria bacterium]HJL58348.1 molybdenum cofactor guanylyltransferase MobA [Alphaproteobacteria bacterium]HJO14023.1 molybdenum cofactor guanylyltransferase MobA [Alphaproteobacteria bacterium]
MINYNNDLCAVILTGGRSSRMGGEIKSLKKFNNKSIFDRIFENLQTQTDKIIINSNDSENLFVDYNVDVIKDSLEGFLGPLAGIHAAMEWLKENSPRIQWLVTVPGDTPFLPKNLVKKLFNKVMNGNNKIVLAQSNGRIHPIIGIWNSSLFESLKSSLNSGNRKIMDWASQHSLEYVEFTNSKYDPFFNINRYEDMATAKEIEKNNYLIC